VREARPVDPAPLPDGTYDAIVVDADDAGDGVTAIELTVLAGPHKGQVLELRGPSGARDPIDLLGVPATITVADGRPSVRLEP
jgi:hypothetical protein